MTELRTCKNGCARYVRSIRTGKKEFYIVPPETAGHNYRFRQHTHVVKPAVDNLCERCFTCGPPIKEDMRSDRTGTFKKKARKAERSAVILDDFEYEGRYER